MGVKLDREMLRKFKDSLRLNLCRTGMSDAHLRMAVMAAEMALMGYVNGDKWAGDYQWERSEEFDREAYEHYQQALGRVENEVLQPGLFESVSL